MRKIFIHTNKKQMLGGKIAKYSYEKFLPKDTNITIEFIIVEDRPEFQEFVGKSFKRGNEERAYTFDDLQSFTLSRFMPPQLMDYEGQSMVIDPDIFAFTDVTRLFDLAKESGKAICACKKKQHWDSSVMVMDNKQLKHWDMRTLLKKLADRTLDYNVLMQLREETSVHEISRIWNSIDVLNDETSILHTSGRETQPWKTGLPVDFTRNKMPKIFGIIPREPIHELLGKTKHTYQQHPDPKIEEWFLGLAKEAYQAGVFDDDEVMREMAANNVRHDLLKILQK